MSPSPSSATSSDDRPALGSDDDVEGELSDLLADRRVRRLILTAEGETVIAQLRRRIIEDATLVDELDELEGAQLEVLLTKAMGSHMTSGRIDMLFVPIRWVLENASGLSSE